jgi:hypothetical protein
MMVVINLGYCWVVLVPTGLVQDMPALWTSCTYCFGKRGGPRNWQRGGNKDARDYHNVYFLSKITVLSTILNNHFSIPLRLLVQRISIYIYGLHRTCGLRVSALINNLGICCTSRGILNLRNLLNVLEFGTSSRNPPRYSKSNSLNMHAIHLSWPIITTSPLKM